MARAFTNEAWPLACVSMTGLSGEALLSASCKGKPSTFGSGTLLHFSWCHPRPMIQSPGLAWAAAWPTIDTISFQSFTSIRSSVIFDCPRPMKCPWLSIRPGMAVCPARSITSVFGPTYAAISSLVPRAAIRSPRMAMACASGRASSTVTILPFRNTSVAGSRGCAQAAVSRIRARAAQCFTAGLPLRFYPSWLPDACAPGGARNGSTGMCS
jgi:hypothetical protein